MAPYSTNTSTANSTEAFVAAGDTIKDIDSGKFETQCKMENHNKFEILEYLAKLKWLNILIIGGLHALFVWESFNYPWFGNWDLILFNTLYGSTGAVGVTSGAHRLWTHRSYKAKVPLRIILMLWHCAAGMNPLFHWVRDHRVHHKFTDTDADPHNTNRGFFFSHMGWLLIKKHPDVVRKGKQVDMSDILEDPVVQFHQKYYIPLVIMVGFVIPTIIPPLLWGRPWYWSFLTCLGRYVLVLHLVWSINSVAHMWGSKPYDKRISPTDGLRLSLCTIGEGWHNYHHAFPWAYKLDQFSGYTADVGSFWIDTFAKIGWAYDLKTPSVELVKKTIARSGDGSHSLWGGHMEVPESAEEEFSKNIGDVDNNNNNNGDNKNMTE